MIEDYNKLDEIKSENSIVIYGYNKKIIGTPKSYTKTELVPRSERTKCGKSCNVKRSWNELVEKTVTNNNVNSIHNSVLIYKIDEQTELLMSINSGDSYTVFTFTNTRLNNEYIFN